jgi:diguanylate cyclase (GGDEF)-like protein/hemerythrin-like metal-binding protein
MLGIQLHTFLILVELLMVIDAGTALLVFVVRRHVMHLMMTLSLIVTLIAFSLLHTFINDPTEAIVVVYNFLFLISTILILGAFRAYYKLRVIPFRYLILVIASGIGFYFFTNISANYVGRVMVNTFFLALFIADSLFEARVALKNEQVVVKRVVITVMSLMIAFFVMRFVYIALFADPNSTLVQNVESTALTTGFFAVINFNFWLVGSVLMQSDRVIKGLNDKSQILEDLAMLDPLSKLYNRNKLEIDFEHIVELSNRQGDIASILLMDIDHFKQINDQFGHDVGDQVLVSTSQVITNLLRADDRVYRWGGDEFLILTPHTDLNGASRLAQRIIDKMGLTTFPKDMKISVSIGCAQHFQYESKADWFKRVDLTLYKAKQAGRNRYEVWANKDVLPSSIAKLIWNESFESGHAEIDLQHQGLVRLSNELYDQLGSADSLANMDSILDRVQIELSDHFAYESNEMLTMRFPLAEEHRKIHEKLLGDYVALREQLRKGTVNLGAFFNFVSVRIVAEHIIKEDTKFFTYFKSIQS